jgi:spore germination protein YaaH
VSRYNIAAVLVAMLVFGSPAGSVAYASQGDTAVEVQEGEVFAFFKANARDYMLESADYSTLTTVAFFAVDALPDGGLLTTIDGAPTEEWAAWTSDWMDDVIRLAQGAGCKVVLTVTRFAWSSAERSETVELLASPDARARLADAIADAVIARGVDGVNLDFEPIPFEVRYEYVSFVRLLRQELDERQAGLFLTFDATGHIANYRIADLTAEGAADAVFVMAYPFKGAGSKRAGAVSPLTGVNYGVPETVDAYLARTSADKVILGLPYYGFEWSTETKYPHSLTRAAGPTYGNPRSQQIGYAIDFAAVHGRRWDAGQLVPWTRWRYRACPSCPLTWRQLYYDDVESLALKYDMVIDRNLAGVGLFKIGNDTGHPELSELLSAKFGSH